MSRDSANAARERLATVARGPAVRMRKTATKSVAKATVKTAKTTALTKAARPTATGVVTPAPFLLVDDDTIDTLGELQRAANAVRQHVEQSVLRRESLTWTGFVVLRAVLRARKIETRHAAAEAGIAKATLTGVVDTLVGRGLARRLDHPDDRRLVLLELTRSGQRLVRKLLPAVRDEEAFALAELDFDQLNQVTSTLRRLIEHLGTDEARLRRL